MRYTKEDLNALKELNKDYYDYLLEYIEEIEKLNAKFEYVEISEYDHDHSQFNNHAIFVFEIKDGFVENKEILERDDDSQPHNNYRIYFRSLIVYETRFV